MKIRNTTLDDIGALVGTTAAIRLVAWFGDTKTRLYIPVHVEEGQLLVSLIGLSATQRLSDEFAGEHLSVPSMHVFDGEARKRRIAFMVQRGFKAKEVASMERISERRVQQIMRELEQAGLILVQGPDGVAVRNTEDALCFSSQP